MLRLDERRRQASFVRQYRHRPPVLSEAEGSVQPLGTYPGNVFVGWGDSTYFTEYDRDGDVVLDARLNAPGVLSYRAFQDAWRGTPQTAPRLAVARRGHGARLYASWNGSTEHRSWRVLGGRTSTPCRRSGSAAHTGSRLRSGWATRPATWRSRRWVGPATPRWAARPSS